MPGEQERDDKQSEEGDGREPDKSGRILLQPVSVTQAGTFGVIPDTGNANGAAPPGAAP